MPKSLSSSKGFKRHKSNSLRDHTSIKSSSLKSLQINNCFTMEVHPIRALQDNYMYLLIDKISRQAAAVDPVNASAIASAVAEHEVDLKAILTTHHHYDHAHGNSDMLSMFPDISIYGGDMRVQALNRTVVHGDSIKLGNLSIECLSTPCHTKGHICYYVTCDVEPTLNSDSGSETTKANANHEPHQERVVFTGDTLFIAGCGRFFEGSSEQMNHNLNVILGGLPPDTKVYCGHEYTVTNLKFALRVEPRNADIKTKLHWAQKKMAKREPTVPSTIGEEKKINPFMRLGDTSVRRFAGENDELEVMTILRQKKNEFAP